MLYKTTTIERVRAKVINDFGVDFADWKMRSIEWINDLLGTLNTPMTLENTQATVHITNYLAEFPCDLILLKGVEYDGYRLPRKNYINQTDDESFEDTTYLNSNVNYGVGAGGLAVVSISAIGSGYGIGDVLTVVATGASGGTVTVTSVDVTGGVMSVAIKAIGTGYIVGTGLTTTVSPPGGTGCVVEIRGVTGTGIIPSQPTFRTHPEASYTLNLAYANGCIHTTFDDEDIKFHYKRFPVDAEGYPRVPDTPATIEYLAFGIMMMLVGRGYQHPVFKDYNELRFLLTGTDLKGHVNPYNLRAKAVNSLGTMDDDARFNAHCLMTGIIVNKLAWYTDFFNGRYSL